MTSTGRNIFNNQTIIGIGPRIENLQNENIAQDKVAIFKLNNAVETVNVSSYGKQLLNETSFASFRQSILEGTEEAIKYTGDSVYEILFYTNTGGSPSASNLRLQITDTQMNLENNLTLNCNDLNVALNKSLIADYVGSRAGENLRLRRGGSVYQEFTATGINVNENMIMSQDKFVKMKIEGNDQTAIIESQNGRQVCLYAWDNANNGLLLQGRTTGEYQMEINNFNNGGYRPISFNRGASYMVVGDVVNNSGVSSKFAVKGDAVFYADDGAGGYTNRLKIGAIIEPSVSIFPTINNSLNIGNGNNYYKTIHSGIFDCKTQIKLNTFAPVSGSYRTKGIFFRLGFNGSTSPYTGDNMAIRSCLSSTLVGDRMLLSAYGGLSFCTENNDTGDSGFTGRKLLIDDKIYTYVSTVPNSDGTYDLGSASLKFNEIYGNNVRAHTRLYASSIQPYSGSGVNFHSSSITLDNNQSITTDNLFSASNRDLYLGNGPSAIKMAIRHTGTIEVSVDLNPSSDQAGDLGSASLRYAQIHGMTLNAGIQVATNQITSYDANEIVNIDSVLRPATNNTRSLGDNTNRWTQLFATNATINTSDRNSKKNITPIKHALDFVRKLKPVQYKWKDGGKRTHTGFIAQDVLSANPLGLKDQWGGYCDTGNGLALRYTEFISINTQAIKELDNKVTRLVNGISGETKVDLNYHTDNSELVERIENLENKKLETIKEEYDDSELREEVKELKEENTKLKEQNKLLNERFDEFMKLVSNKFEEYEKKLNENVVPNVSMNIIETDDGEDAGYDILNGKIQDLEKHVNKIDNRVKKLTTGYNKLVKNM